ncbi:rhamnulose-1-phosphate aldolase/alcohol dehydrogenase [Gaiella occulta]|uniref:Rhamnulose-1-phosphate aldolase/alcohol dehydrogenase n=1 Tax=Gaiella occulta TaxID=1002870 RepID=A0A7M2Z119_9ACTN|nr:bifunctional rhamnulose-1-phosphate aldolase/short-chain dehydrogenase [Gaiella occulta]RDI75819.1 rhamnulose-1-phosphate aldolase/alcohol dehydrogenase [Gaiella occulta]
MTNQSERRVESGASTGGIPSPADLWDAAAAAGLSGVEEVVYRSNLLGADRALANQGGGNTSAKGVTVDHAGRETRTLWVKGSGTDLATITAVGFAALRVDEILPLRARARMDDGEMVDHLRRCALAPDQPRPSIEALLHAFVPAAHVDHTHPDAIIALTSSPNGHRLVEEAFGDEAVWLGYQRPGFDMSRRIAELLEASPSARAVLLEKHGLVTWGETSEEAYHNTLEFVARAAEALNAAAGDRFGLGGQRVRSLDDREAEDLLAASLPALRGALLADTDGLVLEVDRSAASVSFVSSQRGPAVSQVGAPCPDHLINTKHKPLVVDFDPDRHSAADLAEAFRRGVEEYAAWYREYYERNLTDESRPFPIDPAGPRVVLVPGVGIVASGADAGRARFSRDLYQRAVVVEAAAEAAGGFRSLSEAEAFAVEYWPLERYKLTQAPPRGELAGKIALVTGGASGIGRAAARRLAELGAHVVVADLNVEGASAVAQEICERRGGRRALAVPVDVTSEEAVAEMVRQAVLSYGGLDILVCSAGISTSAAITETTVADWERNYSILVRGYFLAAREAFRVLIEQGAGGSIVFVGSKNALVAGKNAAAYSSAKAATLHLARCLAEEGGSCGIRVNTVNPDAVIEGSSIWSSDWQAARARTYGVSEEELPAFYRARTTLGVNVDAEDVAEAIVFFASNRSSKSTGNVVNVDGGVAAAYPR